MSAFARPWLLVLAALAPVALAWLTVQRRRLQRVPALALAPRRARLAALAPALALAGVAAAWFAAAGPQRVSPRARSATARDIVVLLDISSSMATGGPGRDALDDARRAVARLAQARAGDRLALVAFGSRAAVVSPLTRDHATLLALVSRLEPAALGGRTAIGDGLAVALDLLRASAPGHAGIVLVSDGESNAGAVAPLTAAQVAADRGVAVDAIAVAGTSGEEGTGRINEVLMRALAERTGGHFVRSHDEGSLAQAFADLARLQPTTREARAGRSTDDRTALPVLWAAALLLLAAALDTAGGRAWA